MTRQMHLNKTPDTARHPQSAAIDGGVFDEDFNGHLRSAKGPQRTKRNEITFCRVRPNPKTQNSGQRCPPRDRQLRFSPVDRR